MDFSKFLDIQHIFSYVQGHLSKIIISILIFLFLKPLKKHIDRVVKIIMKNAKLDDSVVTFILSIYSFLYYIVLFILLAEFIGIDLKNITTVIGAMGVVLGIVFKETLNNFCGGLILLTFKPFKIGDFIEYNNFVGSVSKIEFFYTKLINPQNELIIVPNGIITNSEIRNVVQNSIRRLDIVIGVGYDSDIKQVKSILEKIVEEETGDSEEKEDDDIIHRIQTKIQRRREKSHRFFSLLFSRKKIKEEEKNISLEDKLVETDLQEILENEEKNNLEIKSNLEETKMILKTKPSRIGLSNLGDSAIEFTINVYTKSGNYLDLKYKLNERIKEELDKANINIPYPQMDIHISK